MGEGGALVTSGPHIAGTAKIQGRVFRVIFSKSKSREKDHKRGGNMFERKKATKAHRIKVHGKPTFDPMLTEFLPCVGRFHRKWICFL